MKPTIGRIVHFHPVPGVTHAAIIAHVTSDTCVNLAAFNSNGCAYDVMSAHLIPPGQPTPEFSAYAEWMPHEVAVVNAAAAACAALSIPASQATAAALERIIQKIDEKIAAED